jgi:hypothetical protein
MFNDFQLVQFLQLGKSCHMTVTKLGEIFQKGRSNLNPFRRLTVFSSPILGSG